MIQTKEFYKFSVSPRSICDSCGQCSEKCPMEIDIPQMLGIFRQCRQGNLRGLYEIEQQHLAGTPMDCIECGACSAHCSKGIDVKEIIREMAMLQCQMGGQNDSGML